MLRVLMRGLSRLLERRPRVLFAVQHLWLRVGFELLDLRMADWVIRRPEWLRQKPEETPRLLEPPLAGATQPDRTLAQRVANFAATLDHRVDDDLVPVDSMWGMLRRTHYANLIGLVESGNVSGLADFQQRIFRDSCVNGFTYGTTFDTWPHRWNYLPVQIELSVVQLAEAIGELRAECHEQGDLAFWRRLCSEEELIARIERFFGFRVEQPRTGDPRGMMFGGRFLTRETCSHLHSAFRMWSAISLYGSPTTELIDVLEIGGGFGGTCYWLRKVMGGRAGRYVIVDLPEVALVQASFLGAVHADEVVLWGEGRGTRRRTIELVPHTQLDRVNLRPQVLINQDSMPEMPESEVARYLDWASRHLQGVFLSFNQETHSRHGEALQVSVPEVARRYPALRRVSRNTSWDRRGYVEEVYLAGS